MLNIDCSTGDKNMNFMQFHAQNYCHPFSRLVFKSTPQEKTGGIYIYIRLPSSTVFILESYARQIDLAVVKLAQTLRFP